MGCVSVKVACAVGVRLKNSFGECEMQETNYWDEFEYSKLKLLLMSGYGVILSVERD